MQSTQPGLAIGIDIGTVPLNCFFISDLTNGTRVPQDFCSVSVFRNGQVDIIPARGWSFHHSDLCVPETGLLCLNSLMTRRGIHGCETIVWNLRLLIRRVFWASPYVKRLIFALGQAMRAYLSLIMPGL